MKSIRTPQSAIHNRPGGVLLIVMICLAVGSIFFGLMIRTGLAEWRLVRVQERQMQAAILAESGLNRAAARLAADADYQGETWQITAAELGGGEAAAVVISVATDGDHRTIKAQADYPAAGDARVRESRERVVGP
jgi:hypothetical protein